MIPGVLVPMALLAGMDFTRKMINHYRKPKPVSVPEEPPTPEEKEPVADMSSAITEEAQVENDEMPLISKESQIEQDESPTASKEQVADEEPPTPEESKNDSEESPHD
jgi:hypothetical protein